MENKTRIAFFGTPVFAVPTLRKLHAEGWNIAAVVTAPDKPLGRKQILTPSPVKVAATELGIPVQHTLENLEFDLGVVVAYGKLIPQRILDIPRLGFVNVHPSLLPKYRGPSPIQSAILNGDTAAGVSIMQLDAEMDHGPVLAQESYTIPADAQFPQIERELSELGADLLVRTIQSYVKGALSHPQDHTQATFTKKFTREDGNLDFSRPAIEVYNRIRALSGNPGAWTTVNGLPDGKAGKTLNILSAHIENGTVIPDRVQLEGGKPMDWESFLRGHPGVTLQ